MARLDEISICVMPIHLRRYHEHAATSTLQPPCPSTIPQFSDAGKFLRSSVSKPQVPVDTPTIHIMTPYFETAKSFADVPITDDGVETATFLLASTDFVNMFDLLGGGVFAFVQNDLRSNIGGVRQRYEAALADSPTLEKLAWNESAAVPARRDRHGTACLVRLVRGLWFTCEALRNMQRDRHAELHVCFRRSFDVNLKPHLPWIVRPVVSLAIGAVPHRKEFYAKLTEGGPHEKFDSELGRWLDGLDVIVQRVKGFLAEGDYGKV